MHARLGAAEFLEFIQNCFCSPSHHPTWEAVRCTGPVKGLQSTQGTWAVKRWLDHGGESDQQQSPLLGATPGRGQFLLPRLAPYALPGLTPSSLSYGTFPLPVIKLAPSPAASHCTPNMGPSPAQFRAFLSAWPTRNDNRTQDIPPPTLR